jgi:hypothetical protein
MSYIQTLRDEFVKEMPYSWRLQSKTRDKSRGIYVPYIEARDVYNKLDQVCLYGWESAFKDVCGNIFGGIGIVQENGSVIWKWDTGMRIEEDKSNKMYDQGAKGSASDSLKRAAVQWGIGRFLYEIDTKLLPLDADGNPVDASGKRIYDVSKYIYDLSHQGASKIPESPKSTKPDLDAAKLDQMVKAINDGKVKAVEDALPKYTLTDSQKKVLTVLISQAKASAATKSVKA